jgi:hypothetical protein
MPKPRGSRAARLNYEVKASDDDPERIGERITPQPNGCWAYDGDLDKYHQVHMKQPLRGVVYMQAHRYTYEVFVGPVPDGYHVHHECQNPGCVNPMHLQALTPKEHAEAHKRLHG